MDKELNEIIKELKKLKSKLDDKDIFMETLKKANNTPCKISVENTKDAKVKTVLNGERLALIILLAGTEKSMLKQLGFSEEEFDFIKSFVSSEEVTD